MSLFRLLSSFLLLASIPLAVQGQISQVMGIDTTQSLGNFDHIFQTIEMPNGNVWVGARCERTLSSSGGQVSNYGTLIQLSPLGNVLASQKSGYRSINALALSNDGNLLLGGEGSGFFCTSGMCKSDMLISKVTPGFSVIWGRSFGNPNYNGSDGLKRVFETADSNIVVVGNIYQSSNNSHPFIAKVNSDNGDTIWTRALAYPSNQFGNDASEGPNGELFLAVSGDLRVFKLTSAGTLDWSKGFANYGQVMRVFAQPDGSVIAAGQYLASGGTYNACLFKISGSGTLLWFKDFNTPSPNHDEMLNDAVMVGSNIFLGGYHYSASTFTGMYPLLIKADTSGTVIWSRTSSTPDGEINTVMSYGTNILCGIDYEPPVMNNRPDILLITTDQANGTNGCFINHPLTTGSPTVTTSSLGSGFYTDYETQPTVIGLSHQGYWETPACLSTGIQSASINELFSISHSNGTINIHPVSSIRYTFEITDIAGRRLFYDENMIGDRAVQLTNQHGQILLVRLAYENGEMVKRIFYSIGN